MNEDYFCEDCGTILDEDGAMITDSGTYCVECRSEDPNDPENYENPENAVSDHP